jgi:hypothetical protein
VLWVNPWVVWWVEGAQKDELAKIELMVETTDAEEPGKKGIPHIYSYSEIMDKMIAFRNIHVNIYTLGKGVF